VGKRRTAEAQRKRLQRQNLRENPGKYEAAKNKNGKGGRRGKLREKSTSP